MTIVGFERVTDFVRSTFTRKIEDFFSAQDGYLRDISSEIPNIEKYEVTEDQERFSSSVHIQRYFADLFEKLPLIAITSTGARQAFTQVGIQDFMDEFSPFVISTTDQPYSLVDQDNLVVSVDGSSYNIIFDGLMFSDISNITIDDFRNIMNQLLMFIRVESINDKLVMYDRFSRRLVIEGGSAVTKLGFVIDQTSESKWVKHFMISETLNVIVDVVTSDRNQRIEIMDLLSSLFGFYVYDKYLGQWIDEKGFIFFTTNYSRSGESETVINNAPVDKLYFDSLSIPVRAFVLVDRVEDFQELNITPESIVL